LQTYKDKDFKPRQIKLNNILDKWIVSRFNGLNEKVINNLEKYDVVSAARLIEDFVDEFSNWYIRRSRTRLQKPKNKREREEVSQTLYWILFKLSKLIAPFTPFISEEIYQNLKTTKDVQSVHLCGYPKSDKKQINSGLESKMDKVREIAAIALAKRAEAGIKVRQPLGQLAINNKQIAADKELAQLIQEEVNVKKVIFGKEIKLDTKLTAELKAAGAIRDLIRFIQGMRKDSGLKPKDKIDLR